MKNKRKKCMDINLEAKNLLRIKKQKKVKR